VTTQGLVLYLLNPSGPRPTSMNFSVHFGFSRSYTYGRTPWAGDQLIARPLPVHKHRNTHTNIHALSGIQTHNPGFRASEASARLRPLVYRDQQLNVSKFSEFNGLPIFAHFVFQTILFCYPRFRSTFFQLSSLQNYEHYNL
jgi:hypothetical protein